MKIVGEELNEKERFNKGGRREWRDEELDKEEGFGLFIFWFGVLDVGKQKKADKQVLESKKLHIK